MELKVKMRLKITPFCNVNYEIVTLEKPQKKNLIETPKYVEPITTNIKALDINYEEGNTYIMPKTAT